MPYAEQTGRIYGADTFIISEGNPVISCGISLTSEETGNFIVISSGAATGIYKITAVDGTDATVTPTPSSSDGAASGNKHYLKNLEDDLNFLRTQLVQITGEASWFNSPDNNIAALHSQVEALTAISGTIPTNHSDLLGLTTGDDHTQYLLRTDFTTYSGTLQDEIGLNSGHRISSHAPSDADNTASNETSHTDVVQDGDFGSDGILVRSGGVGSYTTITDNSSTWNGLDAKIDTTSGTLQTAINGKSDSGHAHDGSYYTETELNNGQLDNR